MHFNLKVYSWKYLTLYTYYNNEWDLWTSFDNSMLYIYISICIGGFMPVFRVSNLNSRGNTVDKMIRVQRQPTYNI